MSFSIIGAGDQPALRTLKAERKRSRLIYVNDREPSLATLKLDASRAETSFRLAVALSEANPSKVSNRYVIIGGGGGGLGRRRSCGLRRLETVRGLGLAREAS